MDWAEILHIITDPPHIAAEVVMEVASYLTIGRLAIWWHDRKHHGPSVADDFELGWTDVDEDIFDYGFGDDDPDLTWERND